MADWASTVSGIGYRRGSASTATATSSAGRGIGGQYGSWNTKVLVISSVTVPSWVRHDELLGVLGRQWNTGYVPTDDLRQAFQRYRAFFQRLLSA